jgi:hypothetical protein
VSIYWPDICEWLRNERMARRWNTSRHMVTWKMMKLFCIFVLAASSLAAQSPQAPSSDPGPEPRNVSLCDIAKDPNSFNHVLVRVTAFVSHAFEDFTLADPSCGATSRNFEVWLAYGGKTQSNTAYCCPGESGASSRSKPLSIEDIPIPLVSDTTFVDFTELVKKEHDTTVRVTLVGRFFAGKGETIRGSTYWRGYGHMGCCSLLAIQRVEAFEPHTRTDVDYSADAGWYEPGGCDEGSVSYLRHVSVSFDAEETQEVIAEQRKADSGERAWAFDDPMRVAIESLKLPEHKAPLLQRVRSTPSREVFRWKHGKRVTVIVVVRPYWLSFFAKGNAVAWVSATIKEVGCP